MNILIIDNYDSFTYNLYQYAGEVLLEAGNKTQSREKVVDNIDVVRNDKITLNNIKRRKYDKIILSPGPGTPADKAYFGVCADVLLKISKTTPILGVCLGMQGMAYYFGGKVVRAKKLMHGKTSMIEHNEKGLFQGLPQNLEIMRYHSLIVEKESLPNNLVITATVKETGEIMGIAHRKYPIEGIQFHPESFATEGGKMMLKNFLLREEQL